MKAIVCIGAPGCGKSTYAALNTELFESNRDKIRLSVTGRVDDHRQEQEITRVQREELKLAAALRWDVIVSDTNLVPRFRDELIAYLESLGYTVELKLFWVPIPELNRRNETRDKPVPLEVIRRMARQMSEQFGPTGVWRKE